MKTRQTLYFVAPYRVEVCEEPLPAPGPQEVLIESICSAISAGSEMLLYRGQFPTLQDVHDALSSNLSYPTPYGYACVGRIVAVGHQANEALIGKLAFVFHAHSSHVIAPLDTVHLVPANISAEKACFFPNTETAINLVQDAVPLLGERGVVFGQGTVGLLTTALLCKFPLETLLTVDPYPLRREASRALGVTESLDPTEADFRLTALDLLSQAGADFSIELSGSPAALNEALALTRFSGRIIIGSWYGTKQTSLELGVTFHRSRVNLYASQVSTIRPELSARWDKRRRFELTWKALSEIHAEHWITHRIPFQRAPEAYSLLDQAPETAIQILLTYK